MWLLLVGAGAVLHAQTAGHLDPSFSFSPGSFMQDVLATAVQPDGKVVVGGAFSYWDGVLMRRAIQRLNADGTRDLSFDPGAGTDDHGEVRSIAVQTDGKILVAGGFSSFNAQPGNVFRLNADGSIDPGFLAGTWVGGRVNCMALQADGKILLAGDPPSLVRLNPDGSLDAGFHATLGGAGGWPTVQSLAVQPDGKIVVVGTFTTVDGEPANRVARLNADGSRDTAFNAGAGANATIYTLAVQRDGKIVIGGDFTQVDGQPRSRIARLETSGALESLATFNAGTGANAVVRSIALQADGKLLLGGGFSQVDTQSRGYLARLNSNGSVESTATFDIGTGAAPLYIGVTGVMLQSDGRILVGGDFVGWNGGPAAYLVRLLNDAPSQKVGVVGHTDAFWERGGGAPEVCEVTFEQSVDAGATWTLLGNAAGTSRRWQLGGLDLPGDYLLRVRGRIAGGYQSGSSSFTEQTQAFAIGRVDENFDAGWSYYSSVDALSLQADEKILAAGTIMVGADPNKGFARLEPDGSADTGFNPDPTYWATKVVVQNDGRIVSCGYTGSQPRVLRFNSDGTSDPSFNVVLGPYERVSSLALQPDGKILLGGALPGMRRVNSDGSLDPTFSVGTGVEGSVEVIVVQPDGRILVGGDFSSINGQPRKGVARLNADGSVDPGFSPVVTPSWAVVYAIALQPDGKILLGGNFYTVNGQTIHHVARLDTNGGVDPTFNIGTGADEWVYSLALQVDGKILLGGRFANVNGQPRGRLARLQPDGTVDTAFFLGAGVSSGTSMAPVWSVLLEPDGDVLIGGDFDTINGIFRNDIARIVSGPAGQSLGVTSATRVFWQRTGAAPEASEVAFEVSSNGGAIWVPLGPGERVSGGWQCSATLPVTGLLRARARTGNGTSVLEQTAAFSLDPVATLPPTLHAPAFDSSSKSPVAVSYSLPEAALAASVRLVFFDGGDTRVLVLASSQEAQGAHSFSFDPANPTASPEVASGPALPDGSYSVTLYYQDALGNPPAHSAVVTNFTIDTHTLLPVLEAPATGAVSKSPVAVSFILPEFAWPGSVALAFDDGVVTRTLAIAESQHSTGAHQFSFSPANPTAAPEILSGPAIPDGVYTVTLRYGDWLGNALALSAPASNVGIDTAPPLLSVLAPVNAEATSAAGAIVTFSVSATDAFDPSPVVNAVPASGSTFHLGPTLVNVSATDMAGNTATDAFLVTVVDTTAPGIAAPPGGFHPTSIVAGTGEQAALPDYTAQPVLSDNVSVTSVTQSPAAGTLVGLGPTTVTLTAHDAAGHSASVGFDVNVRSGLAVQSVIAMTGGDIPGAGTGGIPAGAKWKRFGVPSLNDGGQTAFLATWSTPDGSGKGLFCESGASTTLLAALGDTLASGPDIKALNDPLLGDSGHVTVRATLKGTGVSAGNDRALLGIEAPGTAAILARENDLAPGTNGAKFKAFTSLSRRCGETLFRATLKARTGTPATATGTDAGVWSYTAGWGLELRLREGQTINTIAGAKRVTTFKTLAAASGTPGVGRSHPDVDFAVARLSFADHTTGLAWLDHASGPYGFAISGEPVIAGAPELTWSSFSVPAGRPDAGCAVLATALENGESFRGIFAGDIDDAREVARVDGDAGGDLRFRSLKDPIHGSFHTAGSPGVENWIAFPATLAGPGVTSANNAALFSGPVGAIARLARTGDGPPDVPGTKYRRFKAVAIFGDAPASMAWVAQLSGTGVRTANDYGLWAQNSVGAPHLLLREGQPLGGKTVKAFTVLSSVSGSPDQTRSVDANRRVMVRVDFTDKTQALVRYDVP